MTVLAFESRCWTAKSFGMFHITTFTTYVLAKPFVVFIVALFNASSFLTLVSAFEFFMLISPVLFLLYGLFCPGC